MADSLKLLDAVGDSGAVTLATSPDVFSDFRVNGQQAVQAAPAFRARNQKAYNRGNVANAVSIEITHAPAATPAAAKSAAAALIVAVTAKLATARLVACEFAGVSYHLQDAALSSYDIHARGTSVFASYQFTGGAFVQV